MFGNVLFSLVHGVTTQPNSIHRMEDADGDTTTNLAKYHKIGIQWDLGLLLSGDEDQDAINFESCKILNDQLNEKFANGERNLKMSFRIYKRRSDNSMSIYLDEISVTGEVLKVLQSLMLYQLEDTWLKLKLSVDIQLSIMDNNNQGKPANIFSKNYQTELFPSHRCNGESDHSVYCAPGDPKNEQIFTIASNPSQSMTWQLANLQIWSEGANYNVDTVANSRALDGYKRLLETAEGGNVQLVVKDQSMVCCHEALLIAQSSVFRDMFEKIDKSYQKAVEMKRFTREEVMAFLAFLYYGDLEQASQNLATAISVLEIAYTYDVSELEQSLKLELLRKSCGSFEVDDALNLFAVAATCGYPHLKQKALDILQRKSTQDIKESALFYVLFTTAMSRDMFLMSIRRV